MLMKAFICIAVLVSAVLCEAASTVAWSEYVPFKGFVSLVDEEEYSFLLTSSFERCGDSERIKLKKRPSASVLSEYVSSFLISAFGNEIRVIELLGGRTEFIDTGTFKKPVFMIRQSDTGRLIGATDGFTAALYAFGNDGLARLIKKEFSDLVQCVLPSEDGDVFYTASAGGVISAWSKAGGRLLKHTDVGYVPFGMIEDSLRGLILFYGGFGLFSMDKETGSIKEILRESVKEAVIDRDTGVLTVNFLSGAAAYDYPAMKKLYFLRTNGRVFAAGKRLMASIRGNGIRIYDSVSLSPLADLRFDSGGSSFILPEDFSFSLEGIKRSLAGNSFSKYSDHEGACEKLKAAERGIKEPESDFTVAYEDPFGPVPPKNDKVVSPRSFGDRPAEPVVSRPFGTSSPGRPEYPDASEPLYAESPNIAKSPASPVEPDFPDFSTPAFSEGNGVPAWFATRKNLPLTEAVAAGAGSDDAFRNASKIVRDAAARKILLEMASADFIKNISDIEVKKRFMWMTASSAANSLASGVKMAHEWISPAGITYVHATVDEKLINEAFDKYYSVERGLLAGSGIQEYMARPPNRIE